MPTFSPAVMILGSRPPRTERRKPGSPAGSRGRGAGNVMPDPKPKLHKRLADIGLGSRREMERWIEAGRVRVNGSRATLGDRVGSSDIIQVDGRRVAPAPHARPRGTRVLRYHKAIGEVCTRKDERGRPTVFANLPRLRTGRWVGIGRLDVATTGLLLFTDSGELAHRLMHPSHQVEREYAVRVHGEVTPEMLSVLRRGVELDDGPARFLRIWEQGGEGKNHWYHVVLGEGRSREVRRLWDSQGVQVSRLARVRYGPIELPRGLRPGRFEDLDEATVTELAALVGLDAGHSNVKHARPGPRARRRPKGALPRSR